MNFPGDVCLTPLLICPSLCQLRLRVSPWLRFMRQMDWFGVCLAELGVKVAFTRLGILVALIFIGLPFVVRTVQPIIAELEIELEEASATLGAGACRHFLFVLLPPLVPALLTGFALAFARAIGEYGSVIFIAGRYCLYL